ncbi:50S ribosomal protein S18 alanine acetyltransferase [Nitzschia inconspicua]|uniref:50S ribosomal protein S18 alanine acetyltransferase n=1 Tax=Nitzschia inconspicua TaxID=303405 RepID=A0A9K3KYH8_9STRA|nr:50S ribosomal protein S18 alanine acetyltransferase [Nitzschia inconspicua]
MKRPELLMFALLRSSATALATTGEKFFIRQQTAQTIQLRLATRTDVPAIQRCNLACLPENYNSQFYCSHLRQWPDLALVAEEVPCNDVSIGDPYNNQARNPFAGFPGSHQEPKIVAYLLGKVETRPLVDYDHPTSIRDLGMETLGHVTSLAVQKDYRRLGLAKAMMTQLHHHLQYQGISSCGLHVRTSNIAACRLYEDDDYQIESLIPSYYQDGEDAYFMRKILPEAAMRIAPGNSYGHRGPFFGKKVRQTGDPELKLPRTHVPQKNVDDDAEKQPELLTGTM